MEFPSAVKLPYPLYQDLLDHLSSHAATDEWARSLLERLQQEASPVQERLATARPIEGREEITLHQKAEDWLKFLESQAKDTPGLPDEALTRETIYD